jgi:hypothetical protein
VAFRLYYTVNPVSTAQYQAGKSSFVPMVYDDRDDALRRARQITELGGTPWEIIGDDGTILDRDQIAETLRLRHDLSGPPKAPG